MNSPSDDGTARSGDTGDTDWTGRRLELEIGAPAHGGHCVARHGGEHGRVVFVRHALPGERVIALVTEDAGKSFCRADAVEILSASPHRVPPPCPAAGPGGCGGCDWQHLDPAEQRRLKARVISEQFARLAGLEVDVEVEALPGGPLGWRTRVAYAVDAGGHAGLHRHRSHAVVPLDACPLGAPGVGDAPELATAWPGADGLEVAVGADGTRAVTRLTTHRRPRRRPETRREPVDGPRRLTYRSGGRDFAVGDGGFWQVHPAAGDVLSAAVLDASRIRPGERVLDLYAGAGLFTAALAGAGGHVVGLEQHGAAVDDAAGNLAGLDAEVRRGAVTPDALAALGSEGAVDVVVLDPPRSGAGREVMTAVLALAPRAVVYVACDPASLARDTATALAAGWRLDALRAVDAFPMTHHMECVARFSRTAVVSSAE